MTAAISSKVFVDFFENNQFPSTSLSYSAASLTRSVPTWNDEMTYDNENSDVQVEISGVSFLVSMFAFQRLAKLPWERIHATAYRLEGASPDTFEKILDHVLFGTLPKHKRMTKDEQQDLLSMAQTLGLQELGRHLRSGKGYQKKNRLGAFFGCKNSRPSDVETSYGYRQNGANTFTTN